MVLAQAVESMSEDVLSRLQSILRARAEAVDVVIHEPLESATRAGYRQWLCNLFRFIAPFEASFALTPLLHCDFINSRTKAGYLAKDLLVLGLGESERTQLATRCTVPAFSDPLQALGWLFVVERITLQLDQLRARLLPTLELEIEVAGAFLDVYDGAVVHEWLQFGRVLDQFLLEDRDLEIFLTAARAALDSLETTVADPAFNSLDEMKVRTA
jgi:heme oxygenase